MAQISNGTKNIINANIINNDVPIKSNLASFKNATTEQAGIIRIATDNEARIGKNKNIAITPYTLSTVLEKFVPIQVSVTDGTTINFIKV